MAGPTPGVCFKEVSINRLTSNSAKHHIQEKFQNLFCKMLKNKWYHAKVPLKRFHLNGHTIGFRPQTQKLELHYMSP